MQKVGHDQDRQHKWGTNRCPYIIMMDRVNFDLEFL